MQILLLSLILNTAPNPEMIKLSEALGHLLGKQLEQLDMPIDLTALAKGLENQAAGIDSPLADEACLQEIAKIQDKKNKELEQKNLTETESFFAKNKEKEKIQTLIDGKLQMEVTRKGTGQIVQLDNSPVVRFQVTTLMVDLFLMLKQKP